MEKEIEREKEYVDEDDLALRSKHMECVVCQGGWTFIGIMDHSNKSGSIRHQWKEYIICDGCASEYDGITIDSRDCKIGKELKDVYAKKHLHLDGIEEHKNK